MMSDKLVTCLSRYADCVVMLHTTRSKETAEIITEEGLIYESQLSNSMDRVSPTDPVDIVYSVYQRKDYGHYIIIIAIPKSIYEECTGYAMVNNISIEEVLSVSTPLLNENEEYTYRLDPGFIACIFNTMTGEIVQNNNYNPASRKS